MQSLSRSFRPLASSLTAQRRLFAYSHSHNMQVIPVPVRSDNYAYLLVDEATKKAAAVDVYDVPAVQAAAQKAGVEIVAGLTTHHHQDHSGGNQVRLRLYCLLYHSLTEIFDRNRLL